MMTVNWRSLVESCALVVSILLLLRVGVFFLINPVAGAASMGIRLEAPAADTTMRVALGGFHLGLATMMALGLVMRDLRRPVFLLISAFMSVVLIARIAGIALDGYDARQNLPVVGELITFSAMVTGLLVERANRRNQAQSSRS